MHRYVIIRLSSVEDVLHGEVEPFNLALDRDSCCQLLLKDLLEFEHLPVGQQEALRQVLGFVLNDGTPLRSVEVKVDDGPWQRATLDPANTQFSWKLFTYRWEGATTGEHTLVSRATDVNGTVQPTAAELTRKKTFLEDNSQFPRKLTIA